MSIGRSERLVGWALTGAPAEIIPDSYRDSVSRRLRLLSGEAALLTRVAAVAGLATDMRLLSASAGLSPAEAAMAAQAASDAGLVVLGPGGQRAEFRHALVRDAVLADLRPGERAILAARSLDALAGTAPAVPGEADATSEHEMSDEALELAVDLAEQAGELTRSARLLLTLAGRAMTAGGLATAEGCLRRARQRTAGDLALTARADEALLELLAHQGDLPELAAVAAAALRAGWGDPVSWLRECLAAFDAAGHRHAATACRVLLSRAGATVPRRSGDAAAPPDLAALGITAREADVLKLVAHGLTNREIGERLFLSPRTVEKHVERLLAKTGVPNRSQLVARAARWRTALRT